MPAPNHPPDASNTADWTAFALEYLAPQLRDHAPDSLGPSTLFPRSPLEGDGPCLVFPFAADRTGHGLENHYVVVGVTEPNYYPAYGLDPEDAFSLHVGTRFMLVMQIAQIPVGSEAVSPGGAGVSPGGAAISPGGEGVSPAYDALQDARGIVDRIAPDAKLEDVSIAASFDVDGAIHTVLSATLNGERIYIMGRDAPPGFCRRADLPPQVAYRLHLGEVLRAEPDPEAPMLQKKATN